VANWRAHVRNDSSGGKKTPWIVSPGGKIHYSPVRLPVLPAPDALEIDHPFIRIDNWQIYFFPVRRSALVWLGDSAGRWVRERRCRKYRRRVLEFIDSIERESNRFP
jgi:hypothetical protein